MTRETKQFLILTIMGLITVFLAMRALFSNAIYEWILPLVFLWVFVVYVKHINED